MNRISIMGSPGAGKSTLAFKLGACFDLPVIPIDQIFWQPGWVEPDRSEFGARMNGLLETEKWVIEGNYTGAVDTPRRLERTDLLIFLDPSRLACMYGILSRIVKTYGKVRIDMAPGCPEQFDWQFVKYVWKFPKRQRLKLQAFFDDHQGRKIRLTSRREVRQFLSKIEQES